MKLSEIQDSTALSKVWGLPLEAVGCQKCGQVFLTRSGKAVPTCPLCGASPLAPQTTWSRPQPPELVIPFHPGLSPRLPAIIKQFVDETKFKPDDLNVQALLNRLTPVYWTQWLVDCQVVGQWKAEAGFNYQVKSSMEQYNGAQWSSSDRIETRIRWENRLGLINRAYPNTPAPAFSRQNQLLQKAGAYDNRQATAYAPVAMGEALILAPDLQPDEAWAAALSSINGISAADIQTACSASSIRNFFLDAVYESPHWTQLLLPLYWSGYTDDEGRYHPVFINGQTGQIGGVRMASQRKGWMWAGILAGIGLAGLLAGIVCLLAAALFPPAAILGTILVIAAIGFGLAAIYPAAAPWQWNRSQSESFSFSKTKEPFT